MNFTTTSRRKPLRLPLSLLAGSLALLATSAAFAQDSTDPSESVRGLSIRTISTNVLLTWPSDPRESFLILARSNPSPEAHWTILTNHMPAAAATNRTTFLDPGGAARPRVGPLANNLANFYSALVIPDFWFSPAGALLDGGPRKSGADFLPIYTGTPETDEFNRPFNLHVEMLVDTERGSEEEAIDLRAAVDDGIERVNLGSAKKPHWAKSAGFWFQHDQLTNGLHTLQLRTLLTLNTLVGPGEQFLTITNPSVTVVTTNASAGHAGRKPSPPTSANATNTWWAKRLGPNTVRQPSPSPAESLPGAQAIPKVRLIARPLDLLNPDPRNTAVSPR